MFKEFYRHVQDEVKTIANNLNEENFSLSKQMIEERLQLLESLNSIHPLPTANNKFIDDAGESQLTPDPEPVSASETDDKDPYLPRKRHLFQTYMNLREMLLVDCYIRQPIKVLTQYIYLKRL